MPPDRRRRQDGLVRRLGVPLRARADEAVVSRAAPRARRRRGPGVHEHDQVVADPLDVAHEVRRQDHAHVVAGDRGHEDREELTSRERVQARDGLVHQEQLRSLRERERERELGALAAREPARPLARAEPELVDARPGEGVVEHGVQVRAEPEVVLDAEPPVEGGVRGTKPMRASAGSSEVGWPRTSIDPAVGSSSPAARLSSVDLPAPFGPTSPTTCPRGNRSVQSSSAQRLR